MNTPIKLYTWHISIESIDGAIRDIPLSHEYATEEEANREADKLADHEYVQSDIGWSLHRDTPVKNLWDDWIDDLMHKYHPEVYSDILGYTDTRRNINVALKIICGPDGIPLPYSKAEYSQDVGWPLGM